MPTPSSKHLQNLRKFLDIANNKKQLSPRLYKSLMSSDTLPKYVLKHVHYYYTHQKMMIGGAKISIEEKWSTKPGISKPGISNITYDDRELGQGAFGTVHALNDVENNVVENNVVKIFTNIDTERKLNLLEHLKIVFNRLSKAGPSDIQIYHKLFTFDKGSSLGYVMEKLQPIPTQILRHEKIFQIILKVAFVRIFRMHNKGLIHCDLKIDNLMFKPCQDMSSVPIIVKCIRDCAAIIDYDGCIIVPKTFEDVEDVEDVKDVKTQVENMNKNQNFMITPIFAHDFLIQKLLLTNESLCQKDINTIKDIDITDRINCLRNASVGANFSQVFQHADYHKQIFGKLYNDVFNDANLESCLKFADYYTMAMSFLFVVRDEVQKFEMIRFTINLLKERAEFLRLLHTPSTGGNKLKKMSAPTKPKTGGATENKDKNLHVTLNKNEYKVLGFGNSTVVSTDTKENIKTHKSQNDITANDDEFLETIDKDIKYE